MRQRFGSRRACPLHLPGCFRGLSMWRGLPHGEPYIVRSLEASRLHARAGVHSVSFHMCRYGRPYRKATMVLTNIPQLACLGALCKGVHIHKQLRGSERQRPQPGEPAGASTSRQQPALTPPRSAISGLKRSASGRPKAPLGALQSGSANGRLHCGRPVLPLLINPPRLARLRNFLSAHALMFGRRGGDRVRLRASASC